MNHAWWSLPGPRAYLDGVEHDLRDGRSVILGFPQNMPGGVRQALREDIYELPDFEWREVEVLEGGPDPSAPVRYLTKVLGLPLDLTGTLSANALVGCEQLWGSVIWITGMTAGYLDSWFDFLAALDQPIRNQSIHDRPLFCLPTKGISEDQIPAGAVSFNRRLWRGQVRRLDMDLYVAQALVECGCDEPLLRDLRRAIVAELAGTDPELAIRLSRLALPDLLDPSQILAEYGRQRGWDGNPVGGGAEWDTGVVDILDGRNVVHSAFLALNGDSKRDVERRIWKGQVQVLFPSIEEQRVGIVERFRTHLRTPFKTDFGVVENLFDLEVGHLWYQLRSKNIPSRVKRRLKHLMEARHRLAHLELVPFDLVAKCLET